MAARLKQESSEIAPLLKTLKGVLKARGLLYHDVAVALRVSETTVKRYLTGHSLSLTILERLCRLVDLRMSDLVALAREGEPELPCLTHADEEKLAREPLLASLFYMIAQGHTPQSLQRDFGIDEAAMTLYLTKLDKWGLIQLFPFNRIRLRVSPLLRIERGGPLVKSLRANLLEDMFRKFDVASEDWGFSFAKLSPASMQRARDLIMDFMLTLAKIAESDRDLPSDKADWHGMFLMINPVDIPQQRAETRSIITAKAA